MTDLQAQWQWRYAVKKYDATRKLNDEQLAQLLAAITLAPSSHGLQPYKVLVISDPATRAALRQLSFGQPQVTDASHLFVFAADTRVDATIVDAHFARVVRERGVALEAMLKHRDAVTAAIERMSESERTAWATNQTYLALGTLLFAAAQLGINANPMEGFMPAQYDEALGLRARGLHAVVIAGVGFRDPSDTYQQLKKVRKTHDELFIRIGSP